MKSVYHVYDPLYTMSMVQTRSREGDAERSEAGGEFMGTTSREGDKGGEFMGSAVKKTFSTASSEGGK